MTYPDDPQLMVECFERAIAEFDSNPLSQKLIRRFAGEFPGLFAETAMRFLEGDGRSNAHRFVVALVMIEHPPLFDNLADPAMRPVKAAVNLFRRFLALDPALDLKLARRLPDRSGHNHTDALPGKKAVRALEILDETSRGRRLLPILAHLVNSPDATISARATLFMGRRVGNPAWAARQLQRPEERVRANAIEAIWGLNTDQARKLLEIHKQDASNRVTGNALVGLYIAGDPAATEEIRKRARSEDSRFRATAAWAMGRTEDKIFVPDLSDLLKDGQPGVRGAALRALIRMQQASGASVAENSRPGQLNYPDSV